MIYETTYPNKEVKRSIDNTVGKSFGFIKRLKLGGIGSHRILIKDVSEKLEAFISPGLSVNNLNIELRPQGVIIHLKKRTQTYAWVISYRDLSLGNNYSIIADADHRVLLKDPLIYNQSFFKTLEQLKSEY